MPIGTLRRTIGILATVACGVALASGAVAVDPRPAPVPAHVREDGKVRGITISTHGNGRDWGTDVMVPTIRRIRETGAGWIATHPYAGIGGDGAVRFRAFDPDDPPAYLTRPILEAHAQGLKVLIKPHLAYWGSPFDWRGEISFDRPQDWERFFDEYEHWIVAVARACKDADGFVVGTELDRTVGHEDRWRRIIERVREVTDAPLTYAANWPDYARVPFWDALDVIGIQAYFPVLERSSDDVEVLLRGWRSTMRELQAFSERTSRRVVFTELGYNRAFDAPVRPWAYDTDGPEAEPFQEASLRAALLAIEEQEAVVGVFLWKWFPEPHAVGRNFQLATPRIEHAIRDVWREPRDTDPRGAE